VVDEELVEARDLAHPAEAEEAGRRPGPERRDELGEVPARERCLPSFGEAAPRPGQHQSGDGEGVVLAQDEVRGDIAGRPRHQESRCPGTEFVEQVGELSSLGGVEERAGHTAAV
jgi:hypothetical protein